MENRISHVQAPKVGADMPSICRDPQEVLSHMQLRGAVDIRLQELSTREARFYAMKDDREIAHANIYFVSSDLYEGPSAFIVDFSVDESVRSEGYGSGFLRAVVENLGRRGCCEVFYRMRNPKEDTRDICEESGFKRDGLEYRVDYV